MDERIMPYIKELHQDNPYTHAILDMSACNTENIKVLSAIEYEDGPAKGFLSGYLAYGNLLVYRFLFDTHTKELTSLDQIRPVEKYGLFFLETASPDRAVFWKDAFDVNTSDEDIMEGDHDGDKELRTFMSNLKAFLENRDT